MSQRTTKPRPLRRDNIEARAVAACIRTPADLEEMLASLPTDAQRAKAANLLAPYLPQFIHKRGTRIVVRISDARTPSENTEN